jgi:general secretion pathway protein A
MYLDHFKLRELPFRLSPDPAFLYLSPHHARAKAYMESTIWFTDGFVVITGEIGSGKTTLIETFLAELDKDVVVAQINQTQVSPSEFLQSVLAQFGFEPFRMRKAELLATLNNFLIEQYASGRRVLLIVDEAQNLSDRVLEEIRLLSGVETTKEKVLRIILAGQPELNDKLDSPQLAQLVQRVRLRFHLTPLARSDTNSYIEHRLAVAGSEGRRIFDAATFDRIYAYTGGVPRLINTLCDTAMLAAFAQDRPFVGLEDVDSAIEELQWVEYAKRPHVQAARDALAVPAPAAPAAAPEPVAQPSNGAARSVDEPVVARLLISFDGEPVGERELRSGRLVIGRTPDNDVQLDSKFVSRHHAQIISTRHNSVLEDLNSTNGVFVDAKRVRRRLLNDGDVIRIGRHEFRYEDQRAPAGETPSEASYESAGRRGPSGTVSPLRTVDLATDKT